MAVVPSLSMVLFRLWIRPLPIVPIDCAVANRLLFWMLATWLVLGVLIAVVVIELVGEAETVSEKTCMPELFTPHI